MISTDFVITTIVDLSISFVIISYVIKTKEFKRIAKKIIFEKDRAIERWLTMQSGQKKFIGLMSFALTFLVPFGVFSPKWLFDSILLKSAGAGESTYGIPFDLTFYDLWLIQFVITCSGWVVGHRLLMRRLRQRKPNEI